jgi:hypothetical protein
MAYYMVRVELHGARHDELPYTVLHSAMGEAGFSRTITGSDGKNYRLPPAQYSTRGEYGIERVREAAVQAAARANKPFAVIVTEGQSAWQGLSQSN